MKRYEYPKTLFCIRCDNDVDVEIITKQDALERKEDGEHIPFEYNVAICPKCKAELCSRDFDYVFFQQSEATEKGEIEK